MKQCKNIRVLYLGGIYGKNKYNKFRIEKI